jgi:MFS family permease
MLMTTRTVSSSKSLTVGLVALMSLIALEYMAVAVAMPIVAAELGGRELYSLAFSGALAAGVVGTVLGGRWGDVRGPREPLWAGLIAFTGGLVVAGIAPSMEVLIAGRLVQGFGGALTGVAIYVLVSRVYPESTHPKIFSLFATAWVVPSMVGPAAVGGVAETVGWRWVFLGVPILMVPAVVMLWRGLIGQPINGGQAEPAPGLAAKVGWAGLTAVGAALVQYGSDGRLPVLIAGLVVLAVALPRLLPSGTLRAARGLPAVIALRGLAAGAFIGAEVLVPLMLIDDRHLSPLFAGLSLTGGALTWSFGSWLQGREVFSQRTNLRLGMAGITAGLVLMSAVTVAAVPIAVAYPAWIVAGFGMGLVYPTLSVLTLELSAPGEQGVNSGALQVGEMVFTVVAIAVTGALFLAIGYWAAFLATIALSLTGLRITPQSFPSR